LLHCDRACDSHWMFPMPCAREVPSELLFAFSVHCPDTTPGQHLRVVGNIPSLGCWNPLRGLPLCTSAADFPAWRPTTLIRAAVREYVEYKYVICNSDGAAILWEESCNRSIRVLHLGYVKEGLISVQDIFNRHCYPDDVRFKPLSINNHVTTRSRSDCSSPKHSDFTCALATTTSEEKICLDPEETVLDFYIH